jgi:hypothetical protein
VTTVVLPSPPATTGLRPTPLEIPTPTGVQLVTPPGRDNQLVALLAGAAIVLIVAPLLVWRWRAGGVATDQASMTGILYLFDHETCEARTEILRGGAQQLEVRRRPLGLAPSTANNQDGAGIGQVWLGADGLMLRDAAIAEATALVHDRLYALAGGAVTLRYRSASMAQQRR